MLTGSVLAIRGGAGSMLMRPRRDELNIAQEGNFENLKRLVYVREKG